MRRVEEILEAHKAGLLATVDSQGRPRVRWLTPAVLRGRVGALYALTSPQFAKVAEVREHPRVEWMLQTPSLGEIITLRGSMNVVDNPSLRSEVLEVIGPRLRAFWKLAHDSRDLSVLETVVEEATLYLPMEGRKTVVRFTAAGA
jgi:pyridoxamine 5'-phosphate oxidase